MEPLKIVFMGSAELSCPSLRALALQPGFRVSGVVTQPDRAKGRNLALHPPPPKELALELGLKVLQPEKARNPAFIEELSTLKPDLIVVVAYGQILPQSILDLPSHRCINVHTSLLPRYRGAAPIQFALLNGDKETGVTIMGMEAGLDTGPIISQTRIAILPDDTALTLHDKLAQLGAQLLLQTIPGYVAGELKPVPQPAEGATYAKKITRQDGWVDWQLPAKALHNRWRAFYPWPGLHTEVERHGQKVLLKILNAEAISGTGRPGSVLEAGKHGIAVACGEGALLITRLQLEGGKPLTPEQYLAGHPLLPGTVLA